MKKPPCGSPFELPSDCGGLSVLWAAVQKAEKLLFEEVQPFAVREGFSVIARRLC